MAAVVILLGLPDRKETIDRRRKSQSNDCRSGWGRVNHGAKDDSNSEHFFPTPNKLLTFFIMPNDTTECDTEIESKNAALFKRYGNLDQVFFVHTILIRDHERIFQQLLHQMVG